MLNILETEGKFKAICECQCGNHFIVKNKYDARKSPIGHLCSECKSFISKAKKVSKEFLRQAFVYNELTGDLTYKVDNSLGKAGAIATAAHSAGYLTTRINGKDYLAHRVIWLYMTGDWPDQIDHINHNRADNAWSNLRDVTDKVNHQNESLSTNSTTKVLGVSLIKATGKYRAYIMINRKQLHLGVFDTVEEAQLARQKANKLYGFHPNHGSV